MRIKSKVVRESFRYCFENVDDEDLNVVETFLTRSDSILTLDELISMTNMHDLSKMSDEEICILFGFEAGIQYLLMHVDKIASRELLMHLLASAFMSESMLLDLLEKPIAIVYCDDSYLDYLSANPNIYKP